MDFLKSFRTRWDRIPGQVGSFRLLCSKPTCSLSCANIKNGKLHVTSIHGVDRHSQELSKNDMVFTTVVFLNSLSDIELEGFTKIFNTLSPTKAINLENIDKE